MLHTSIASHRRVLWQYLSIHKARRRNNNMYRVNTLHSSTCPLPSMSEGSGTCQPFPFASTNKSTTIPLQCRVTLSIHQFHTVFCPIDWFTQPNHKLNQCLGDLTSQGPPPTFYYPDQTVTWQLKLSYHPS